MPRSTLHIELSSEERSKLEKLLKSGVQLVRVVLWALALLRMSDGEGAVEIARQVALTEEAIRRIGHRYLEGGWIPGQGEGIPG